MRSKSPYVVRTRTAAPGIIAAAFAWTGGGLFAISLGFFLYSYVLLFNAVASAGSWLQPVLMDIGLFSVFALHHSLLARTRFKAWVGRHVGPALERSIYTWIASLLFIAVCAAWQPVPGVLYHLPAYWAWLGFAVQLTGILLTAMGSGAVDVLDLSGIRSVLAARSGRAAARVPLVTSGAYALVRHPIYLAWTLLVFGAPFMTATRFVFAVVSTAYLAVAIPWEERGLVKAFGPEYERYQRAVRWRMLPFLY